MSLTSSFDNWDPMAEDYTSSFNSYSSLNKALADNLRGDNSADRDFFSLYIKRIPKEVNQEVFLKKCAKYGVIKQQKIFEYESSYSGLIRYSSEDEARHALKELHRTPPLHLDVQYANKQKFTHNQALRMRANMVHNLARESGWHIIFEPSMNSCHQNSSLLNDRPASRDSMNNYQIGLGRSQFMHKSDTSLKDIKVIVSDNNKRDVLDASISENQTRSLYIGRGTSLSNSRPQISRSPGQITSPLSGRNFAPNYDDKNSYHLKVGRNSSHVERDGPRNGVHVDRIDSKKFISQPPPLVSFHCFRCGKSGNSHCSLCTTPYCSSECQKLDWPEHEKMCKSSGKDSSHSDSSTLSATSNVNGYSSDNTTLNRKYEPKLKIDLNGKSHSSSSEAEDKGMKPAGFQFENSCSRLPNKIPPHPTLGKGVQNAHSQPENKSLGKGNFKSEVEKPSKILKYGNLKKANFPKSGEKVIVWQVETPRKFWVISDPEKETMLNIERDIVKFKSEIQLSLPTKWDLCCVLNKEKQKLGRAVVTEVDGKMKVSQVRFVDYGGTEKVNFKDIYLLPDQLMKYPALVVPCTLPCPDIPSNVNSDEMKNLFRDITLGNEFKAFNVKGSDELCELSLVNSNGVSVSSLLDVQKSSILLSCLESSVEGKKILSPETEGWSKIPTIYTELKVGSKLVISPSIEEDNKVWILASFPNSSFAEDIGKLDSCLGNLKTEDVSRMLKVGDVVAGFSTKYGNFYRCIVLKCLKDKLLVRYIDFGNEEEITRCQKLTPDLLNIRSCVLHCKCSDTFKKDCASAFLKGEFLHAIVNKVMPDYVEISASGSETKHLIKCCSIFQDIKCHVSEQNSQELVSAKQTVISLPESGKKPSLTANLKNFIPSPTSVPGKINAPVPNKDLSPVSRKLVSPVNNMPLKTKPAPVQESVAKNTSLLRLSNDDKVEVSLASSLLKRTLPNDKVVKVIFWHVENSLHYCQLFSDIKNVNEITSKLLEIPDSQIISHNPKVGELYSVKSSIDSAWYRASIEEVCQAGKTFKVCFVDFGNCEVVQLTSMKHLPKELVNIPRSCIAIKVHSSHSEIIQLEAPVFVKAFGSSSDEVQMVNVFGSLQPQELQANINSEVMVTHFENDIFYCHKKSDSDQVAELSRLLTQHCKVDPVPIDTVLDNVYRVKCSDGLWYRGTIKSVTPDKKTCIVNFVDYGNCDNVSFTDVHFLSSELKEFPIFSIPFKISDSSDVKQILSVEITVKAVGTSNGIQLVDIVLPESVVKLSSLEKSSLPEKKCSDVMFQYLEGDDLFLHSVAQMEDIVKMVAILQNCETTNDFIDDAIVDQMVCSKSEDGCWYRGCVKEVLPESKYSIFYVDYGNSEIVHRKNIKAITKELSSFPIFSIPVVIQNPLPYKEHLTLQHIYSVEVVEKNSKAQIVRVLNSYPKSALEKRTLQLNSQHEVFITCLENDIYFMQLSSDMSPIDEMNRILVDCTKKQCITHNPYIGELVCARSKSDDMWHRGCIEEILPSNSFMVLFVDYGTKEEVNSQSLQSLPDSLLKYPVFSIPATMSNVGDLKEDIQFDSPYEIIVESEAEIHQMRIVPEPEKVKNDIEVATASVHSEQLMYCDCEHDSVETGDHIIIIVSAEKYSVVFMLADEKIIGPITELTGSITEFCTQLQCSSYNGEESIVNGQMVLAKYGDEWFRACVMDISPDNSQYEVYFVDFGNTEHVKLGSLRKMEAQFMSFKIHAHMGELKGYSYKDETKDAIMKQLQNFINVPLDAYIEKDYNYQDAGFYCLNSPQITQHLVELNLATVQT